MKSVERLHIDELKNVEKQVSSLLKIYRKQQKDFVDLQQKFDKLTREHSDAQVSFSSQHDDLSSRHKEELERADEQWQQKYEATIEQLNEEKEKMEASFKKQLADSANEYEARIQQLNSQIEKERAIKKTLLARVRGISEE